jgi:hypothetical protein
MLMMDPAPPAGAPCETWQGEPERAKAVHDEALLSALEAVADHLRIPVTYAAIATEDLSAEGGLCVIRGERRIIIERSLSCRQKVRLLAAGLAHFDLEDVFILPVVRETIEVARSHHTPNPAF